MKYRIFGDTGGHFEQLYQGLQKAGMTEDMYLPDDVTIIHCGDLVHKGKGSNEIVSMVDTIMKQNPGQWIQLFGNHEAQYLGGIPFWRDNKITSKTVETLQKWWVNGDMVLAYGLPSGAIIENEKSPVTEASKPILFTHAGMTKDFWKYWMNHPRYADELDVTDVMDVVKVLNSLSIDEAGTAGVMLSGDASAENLPPSPIWAHCVLELWYSWEPYDYDRDVEEDEIPFIQIHGHTSPFSFADDEWYKGTYLIFKNDSVVDLDTHSVWTSVGDSLHVAIDPGYEKTAPDEPQPFLSINMD